MLKPMQRNLFLMALAILICWAQPGPAHSQADPRDLSPADLRELLTAHPELVLDVLRENSLELLDILEQGVMAKRELERRKQEEADLATERNPQISEDRPIRGNPDAPITIVEYSDFLCPYCSQATATVKDLLAADESGQLRLVFKHLPLNPVSQELALAYEAVARQSHEAAWRLHDLFFERQAQLRNDHEAVVNSIVADLGIDMQQFAADRADSATAEQIREDMEEARGFGFSGTPMFLINGIPVRGAVPIHEFQRIVDLAGAKSDGGSGGE